MQNIRIIKTDTLSDNRFPLLNIRYEYDKGSGKTETVTREVYKSTNGATILLYNPDKKTVLLTRQFRLATYLNNNPDGMLIEACAGVIEDESPEEAIVRETEEELGYRISEVTKIFEAYVSPGTITETIYFYIARYTDRMKEGEGGGLEEEQESIEILEMPFQLALDMTGSGEIKDARTIMLLQYLRLKGIL